MSQVALITGGSRGIGASTAKLLAQRGWSVCLSYRVNEVAANEVVHACRQAGSDALAIRADLRSEDDIADLFRGSDRLGALGVLVNNAGIVAPKARVDEMDRSRIAEMMTVNVVGPFLCASEAVRRMSIRHGGQGGVIVNVSSAAARLGSANEYVDYAASKGAVDTMTIGLAQEVAAEGIRVNAVRPGFIETDIHASGGRPDRLERLRPSIPMQRTGAADEIAETIAWLCSDAASYVTGALVDAAGGR